MAKWLLSLWSFGLIINGVYGGCWERRICCPGRNVSCSSTDSQGGWHLHMDSKVKMPPGYHLEDFFEGLYTAQKRLAKLRSPVSSPDGFEVDFNEELLMVTTEEPTQSTSRRRAKEVVIDLNKKSVDFIVSPTTSIPPTDTPHVRDLQELGVGEVGEESSGEGMEIGVPKIVEKFANLRLDNLTFIMSDGSNVSASSFFDKATDTLTTTVSPIAVVSAKYGTPKPAVPTSDPHETLRLIFDDSGDFISIEKHIVNDTNDWISDAEISETRKEQNVADRMLGDQPRSQNHPKTALDSVISYVVVDEHLLPESLEKFGKLQEYLGRQPKGKICYCDDVCAALNDCCRDYEAVCPAVDCRVGSWSEWSSCEVSSENDLKPSENACGEGISRRTRVILESPDNGGAQCPELEERRACYKAGPPCNDGISEVALLLPHKYGSARVPGQKNNVYYDIPKVMAKYNDMNSYCIHFELNSLNQLCSDTAVRDSFLSAKQICVECQPTAQLAKERCVGEGAIGVQTLWNVLNTPQCFGFWTRVKVTTKCSCSETTSDVPAYIFV